MAIIHTAYDIGDTVYHASTTTETFTHECPDCMGSREWLATSPAGGEFRVPCPRCSTNYQARDELNLKYVQWVASVRRLTVGSIQANTAPDAYDAGNRYMCVETGVGSGSVYSERDLYATEAEARSAATAKAGIANADATGWVAKQYDKRAEFSDYQFKDAQIEAARSASSASLYAVGYLLEDLDGAESLEDVRRTIEAWREKREAA